MWRAWMSEEGGLAAGGRVVRRFAFSGRSGSGRKDGLLVDMADTRRAVGRLGRRVVDLDPPVGGSMEQRDGDWCGLAHRPGPILAQPRTANTLRREIGSQHF